MKYLLAVMSFCFLLTSISSNSFDHSHIIDYAQINPKFRRDLTSPVNQTTAAASNLLQLLTPKPKIRDHISFVDFFFQQKLRALFAHNHAAPTRAYIKNSLR